MDKKVPKIWQARQAFSVSQLLMTSLPPYWASYVAFNAGSGANSGPADLQKGI